MVRVSSFILPLITLFLAMAAYDYINENYNVPYVHAAIIYFAGHYIPWFWVCLILAWHGNKLNRIVFLLMIVVLFFRICLNVFNWNATIEVFKARVNNPLWDRATWISLGASILITLYKPINRLWLILSRHGNFT